MEEKLQGLMGALVNAMVDSATDVVGNGYPDWWMDKRDGQVNGLTILTTRSHDPRRSRTGGEYDFYLHVDLRPDGVDVWEGSSCELVSSAEHKARSAHMFAVSLSPEGLERMAKLAEARALIQIVPKETLDPSILAVLDAACAMFDSPRAGIARLKEAVKKYESGWAAVERWEEDTGREWPHR